jgi:short-subunit dehydrogenase
VEVLAGRTALVTGAAGGLGARLSRALAREGMALVLSGRDRTGLEALRDELRSGGAAADVVEADLSRREDVLRVVPDAERVHGPVDLLVNNAGIEITKRFTELTDEDVDRATAVNLVAPMLLTRAVLPGMLARGRGHVVTVASMSGKVGVSCNESYSATKAAVIALTRSLRAEFRHAPVGFSAISPGFIADTGMYGRFTRQEDVHASRLAGEVDPERVVDATLDAIRRDRPDVVVNGTPIRPALALDAVAPRVFERMADRFGVHEMFERVAVQRSGR